MDLNAMKAMHKTSEGFPDEGPCLIRGGEKLSAEKELRVPALPPTSLVTEFLEELFEESTAVWQNGCEVPGAIGKPIHGLIVETFDVTRTSANQIRKPKRELHVEVVEEESIEGLRNVEAGDAFYFLFSNPEEECLFIARRIGIAERINTKIRLVSKADGESTARAASSIPSYISDPCSANYVLKHCLDIRRSPSRPVLRALAEFASDEGERRRLNELCSVQGSSEYTNYVRKTGISLVDLLMAFPSCKPTLARLIEILPRLLPRAYSLASYHHLKEKNRLRFVYSLLKTSPERNGIQFERHGVCSQWMMGLQVNDKVNILLKEPSKFRLPPISNHEDAYRNILEIPLIMIGPGTGVAPFLSFLEKIKWEQKKARTNITVRRYLFYGSSNLLEEFLFKKELEEMQETGLVSLILCESRVSNEKPNYVQDAIAKMGKELIDLMENSNALLYSCGDLKNFSKDIWACLSTLIQQHLNYSPNEAIELLKKWRTEERFIEDVWS